MQLSIGLPNAIPGASGAELTEWARRAEARGFRSVAAIDRVAYPSYEPLTALAGAAAVTDRVGLATMVLLAPLRVNAAALAKQALSVQELSGGRLTLGLGLGGRDDDYELTGIGTGGRGKALDAMLARMEEIWEGGEMGPATHGPPEVVVGGSVAASFARAARFGAGWAAGGVPPKVFAKMATAVREEWSRAGREGDPRLVALAYFALGEGAEDRARSYLTGYYGWLGEETASHIAAGAVTDPSGLRERTEAFATAGCDELFLMPCASDPDQVDLLAAAAGL